MTSNSTRVWAKLPLEIHEYFFRRVLAGEHRAKHDLTTQFFTALYNECQRRNIPAAWNNENIQLIADIMANLNFNDDTERSRRPLDSSAQHEEEPPCRPDDPRPTNGTGQATPASTPIETTHS
jgi:hypothetical protein